jgi:RHS repeat-associated protein
VNQFYSVRNREVGSKHVFVGTGRIVTKLVKGQENVTTPGDVTHPGKRDPSGKAVGHSGKGNNGGGSGGGAPGKGTILYEPDLFYYHPNHLGSTSFVTDVEGEVYQHLEYFPFGETWIEEVSNQHRVPFLFTAKELDRETGLYYFGARYYDPRTSVWQSPDPVLEQYLGGSPNGGVFAPQNLGLFTYSIGNPIRFTDPNGETPMDRAVGALKLIGGFGEAAVGAIAGAATSWTGIGAIGGGVLFLHGSDVAATGLNQLITGEPARSLTSQGVQSAAEGVGISPQTAMQVGEEFDTALSVGGTLGASAALATAPTVVANFGRAGAAAAEGSVVPKGINWKTTPTRGQGGVRYFDPKNSGNAVRVMPGNPRSPYPNSRSPYVRWQKNGQALDVNGNIVPKNTSDAHIPLDKFQFKPELFE